MAPGQDRRPCSLVRARRYGCLVTERAGGLWRTGHELCLRRRGHRDLEAIVSEMATGYSVHSTIVAHYILRYGSEEQKQHLLPKRATGGRGGASALTAPGTGSDLQAVRTTARHHGNEYRLNGQKTFITNGQLADLIIVVAKTGPGEGAKGISLVVLETGGAGGFRRGRNLDKIGLHAS